MVCTLAIVFLLLSILFFKGKCLFLISGYNMCSKAEKEKYDTKKLGYVMGSFSLILAILLFVECLLGDIIPFYSTFFLTGIIFVVTIITTVLCNTICKKK